MSASILSTEKGMISGKSLFLLFLLFVVVHLSIKLVPMYIDAERLKDEMSVKARLAQNLKDEEILADLVKKAKELDLPLGPEDFIVKREDENRRMTISTKWDVTVHLFFDVYPPFTTKTYHFEPVIREDYTRRF
jgi:predicted Holliday junction resolvase-like endonuclease